MLFKGEGEVICSLLINHLTILFALNITPLQISAVNFVHYIMQIFADTVSNN